MPWSQSEHSDLGITPGSHAGLEPRSGGKSVAVQPIVKALAIR